MLMIHNNHQQKTNITQQNEAWTINFMIQLTGAWFSNQNRKSIMLELLSIMNSSDNFSNQGLFITKNRMSPPSLTADFIDSFTKDIIRQKGLHKHYIHYTFLQ